MSDNDRNQYNIYWNESSSTWLRIHRIANCFIDIFPLPRSIGNLILIYLTAPEFDTPYNNFPVPYHQKA